MRPPCHLGSLGHRLGFFRRWRKRLRAGGVTVGPAKRLKRPALLPDDPECGGCKRRGQMRKDRENLTLGAFFPTG